MHNWPFKLVDQINDLRMLAYVGVTVENIYIAFVSGDFMWRAFMNIKCRKFTSQSRKPIID